MIYFLIIIGIQKAGLGKLYVMCGSKPQEVPELHAGDIGALAKLSGAMTTDSLSTRANPILFYPDKYFRPYTGMRYKAKNKGVKIKFPRHCRKSCRKT